ncbi:cobamide remodeling phosphodiesterase CbiR [Seleniivibrio sp.]|uniref:cobamide remodeling phosphodiesterase CbiR n=1 Tax=Seleniivibrio sp. TaxID=2898801 RepID=UPI0025E72A7D|nr:cobamide remodeling phosphodiesterase CbiR [Seleniivibrio sp.]MCD8554343.1 hypothetical protein [Seleniivibrio sp.]
MKISAPSFVIPDSRVNNVLYLKAYTDEVELLFFDSRHDFDMPSDAEIAELAALGMGYSIHLPTDNDLNTVEGWRVIDAYIEKLRPLKPLRMVIHPAESAFFLKETLKRQEHNLIIENTDFYGSFFDDAVGMGLKLCFDNPHAGEKAYEFHERHKKYISEYHLQGETNGKHHKSLEHIEPNLLESILANAKSNGATVCLEMFSKDDFLTSYEIIRKHL